MIRFSNIYIIVLLMLMGSGICAQNAYVVYGRMKTATGRLDGRIEVEKNGAKDRVLKVDGSGKFEFELDYNSDYILSFSQDGYVTKKISFSTHAPADRIQYGFDPFEFQVEIFKQYDDISTVVFNQPVGQIRYSKEIEDFDYDKDYSQSVLREMEKVAEETKKKEEAEERSKKEKAKEKPQPPKEEPAVAVKEEEEEAPPPRTPPPPPEERKPEAKRTPPPTRNLNANLVVLKAYTVGIFSYPNLSAYGYINFGDGGGNREISKEQFDQYAQLYR